MSFPKPFFNWRPHPWHGLEPGPNPPGEVYAYIEITPFDMVKYELDKLTGYIHVDRPQRSSSSPPSLYGFIPKTYCSERLRALSPKSVRGDGDPLDICVISERHRHYFSTYKLIPGNNVTVSIEETYGREHAYKVVKASLKDYEEKYGETS